MVKVDGSGRLTIRNRRYLCKFTSASPNIESASPATIPKIATKPATLKPTIGTAPEPYVPHPIAPQTPLTPDSITRDKPQIHAQVPQNPSVPDMTPDMIPDMAPDITPDIPRVSEQIPLALKRLKSHNNPGLNEEIIMGNGGRITRGMDLGGM